MERFPIPLKMYGSDVGDLRRFMAELKPEGLPTARFVKRARNNIRCPGKRLGILDASFNPMTRAHEEMIKAAREAVKLDELLLVLSRTNVDKKVFGADLGQRLTMLLAYAEDWEDVSVSGCSHPRFVDKSAAVSALYPRDTEIYFILGYDTLTRLLNPKYYDDTEKELGRLFERAKVIAANRGANGEEAVRDLLKMTKYSKFKHRIHFVHLEPPFSEMSSTEVRRRRRRGDPIGEWVPGKIADTIQTMELYNE